MLSKYSLYSFYNYNMKAYVLLCFTWPSMQSNSIWKVALLFNAKTHFFEERQFYKNWCRKMKQLMQNVALTQIVATLDAECNKFFNANLAKQNITTLVLIYKEVNSHIFNSVLVDLNNLCQPNSTNLLVT